MRRWCDFIWMCWVCGLLFLCWSRWYILVCLLRVCISLSIIVIEYV